MEIKKGSQHVITYPYRFSQNRSSGAFEWYAGCEQLGLDKYRCDAVGSIIYDVLAVVELEAPHIERAIVIKTYVYPDLRQSKFPPEMMTTKALRKKINQPYRVDYDVLPDELALSELDRISDIKADAERERKRIEQEEKARSAKARRNWGESRKKLEQMSKRRKKRRQVGDPEKSPL